MFKNIKFFALALLVTATSVSFASEAGLPEGASVPANGQQVPPAPATDADQDQDALDPLQDPAPKKECKYKVFVQNHKKSFIGAGSFVAVAAILGFVYHQRTKQAAR